MTDQTTETLRTAMRELVDMAPAAPGLPNGPTHVKPRQPVGAFAAGFVAVLVVLGLGTVAVMRSGDEAQNAGADVSMSDVGAPTTVVAAVPDQAPATTLTGTPTTSVVEGWTVEDSQALLADAEWDRVVVEGDIDRHSPALPGGDWNARSLKWHEDDMFSITALERGERLPVFGSLLSSGGFVDPESIIDNGRPLFVLIWRPSPWLVAGTETTTVQNLDAFQEAYDRWGDQLDFIGVIWNEPIQPPEDESGGSDDIVEFGRQVIGEHGYTFPNVIGRVDLPEVPERYAPMWVLAGPDGSVTGGFFAHGAVRQADTALGSLPIDHLLSRLVIPIDVLADALDDQYLWAPEYEGGPPREEPPVASRDQ